MLIGSPSISKVASPEPSTDRLDPSAHTAPDHSPYTDLDAHTHGTVYEITDVLTDDLDTETGRPTDAYSYRLQDLETDETLPMTVRHQDLVPAENIQ